MVMIIDKTIGYGIDYIITILISNWILLDIIITILIIDINMVI